MPTLYRERFHSLLLPYPCYEAGIFIPNLQIKKLSPQKAQE